MRPQDAIDKLEEATGAENTAEESQNIIEKLTDNATVQNLKDKVDEVMEEHADIVENIKDKVEDFIEGNETAKAIKEKVEDVIEEIKDNDVVEKVTEFAKEHGDEAKEVIEQVTEKAQSSGLLSKLKGFFCKK